MRNYLFNYRLILLFLLLAPFTVVFSQKDLKPGIIITNNNDTITGFIDLKANHILSRQCNFTTNAIEELKTYLPGEIKGYIIENEKFYITREIEIDSLPVKVFLEYLVDGIADLYYLKNESHGDYYLEKGEKLYRLSNEEKQIKYTPSSIVESRKYGADQTYILPSNKYIGMLSIAFNDCPGLRDQIYHTAFTYKELIKITKDYHNKMCSDYECIEYSKRTKAKVFIEPHIGIVHSFTGFQISKQKSEYTFLHVGINFRFQPLQTHYLWNLLIGASYSGNRFDEVFEHNLKGLNSPVQAKLDYSVFRIPVSVEYTFPTGKLQPFILATYTNAFLFNANYEVRPVYEYPSGASVLGTPYDTPFRTFHYGLGGGLGLKYKSSDSSLEFIKCEFAHMGSYTNTNKFFDYMKVNSITISVGYGIRLW